MSDNAWSARALGRRIGIPHATVSHWISIGLIEPARRGRGRRGHDLGIAGLLELLAVRNLRDAGISVRAIRRAVEHLRDVTGHRRPLSHLILLVVGDDVLVRESGDEESWVSVLRNPTQRVMVFPIGGEHRRLLEALSSPSADDPYLIEVSA
jgi:DNA-binding transcriptional MerR regulator